MANNIEQKNPSRNTKGRAWVFTWNNYSDLEYKSIVDWCDKSCESYVIGKEKGDSGTPHLQGCFKFLNNRSFNALKRNWTKMHIELCDKYDASCNYCAKGGDYSFKNIDFEKINRINRPTDRPSKSYTKNSNSVLNEKWDEYMESEYSDIKWYPWQYDVLNIIKSKPNRRTINWFWNKNGNNGKSYLAMYIDWKYKTIILNGKQNDVFNGIKSYLDETQEYPEIVILDVPRVNQDYVCYGSMEKIKDGLFYSGKYEGGKIRLLPLHLFVFANFEPDYSKFSQDRWNVINCNPEDN